MAEQVPATCFHHLQIQKDMDIFQSPQKAMFGLMDFLLFSSTLPEAGDTGNRSPVFVLPKAPPWAIFAQCRTLAAMDWPQLLPSSKQKSLTLSPHFTHPNKTKTASHEARLQYNPLDCTSPVLLRSWRPQVVAVVHCNQSQRGEHRPGAAKTHSANKSLAYQSTPTAICTSIPYQRFPSKPKLLYACLDLS